MTRASRLTAATDRTRLPATVIMTATGFSKAHHAVRATIPVTARVAAEPLRPQLARGRPGQLIASTSLPVGIAGLNG
jgi:hypothetical protein